MDKQIDMLNGKIWNKLILFSLPLAGSSILQQLFNSVDVAVVGRFAGSQAQAAVGANVANVGIFVNFIVGLSIGPNIVTSVHSGKGDKAKISESVHTTMILSLIIGMLLLVLGEAITKHLLILTATPDSVIKQAELYFRIYLLGLPMMLIYNFGSAIFRSAGDTGKPFVCLVVSGLSNIVMNLLLVIVFHMAVVGVAIATVLSNFISAVMICFMLFKRNDEFKLERNQLHLNKSIAWNIVKLGFPAGIQGTLFSISNAFVQKGINAFGEAAISGSAIALNFEYFTYDVAAAFAQGAVSFSSQNIGAGKYERCKKVLRDALIEGILITQMLCLIFYLGRYFWAGLYSTDREVIDFAVRRMILVMSLEGLTATYEVGCAGLRCMGYAVYPSVLSVLGTVVFRLIWMYTVFAKWHNFEVLMLVYVSSWIFTGLCSLVSLTVLWKRKWR